MRVHLNIGTNLGNRRTNLSRAVDLIKSISLSPIRCSEVIESEPWGYKSSNMFLNQGVEIETNLTPSELISSIKRIQNSLGATSHRNNKGDYVDRNIDIDIIFYGNSVYKSEELEIPHPRMHLREFVLAPIVELSPEWKHPQLNMTAAQILENLKITTRT